MKDGIEQYKKWLSRYAKLDLIYIKSGGDVNKLPKERVLYNEAVKLIKYIRKNSFNILLDKSAKQLSSEAFSKFLNDIFMHSNKAEILFTIGGVHGVDNSLESKFDMKLSLSRMTFTHEFTVLILLEQLYRAFKIINNEKYHY